MRKLPISGEKGVMYLMITFYFIYLYYVYFIKANSGNDNSKLINLFKFIYFIIFYNSKIVYNYIYRYLKIKFYKIYKNIY